MATTVSPRLGALFGWPRSSLALGRNTPVPDDDPKELVETL
jgi:hypothetical protein